MQGHRKTIRTTLIALAILATVPAAAHAGSLLSGYGGPGQGSQVLLGSQLLGGGGAGGGAGTAGAGAAGVAASASEGASAGGNLAGKTGAARAGSRLAGAHAHTGAGPGAHGAGRPGPTAAGANTLAGAAPRLAPAAASSVAAEPLGFSAEDLLYTLLVLAALVLAAVLTRGLARPRG